MKQDTALADPRGSLLDPGYFRACLGPEGQEPMMLNVE